MTEPRYSYRSITSVSCRVSETCETTIGFEPMLVKRHKKVKPAMKFKPGLGFPGRQVLCYHCHIPVSTDNCPGQVHPPYCCTACKGTYPPTEEEELTLEKQRLEARERYNQMLSTRNLIVRRLTKAEKAELDRSDREQEIFDKRLEQLTAKELKWFCKAMGKIIPMSNSGRKKDPTYEEWMHLKARAEFRGESHLTLRDFAKTKQPTLSLPDKAAMDRLRDQYKKAEKRRKLPAPPKR
jgi:hypothetical protein